MEESGKKFFEEQLKAEININVKTKSAIQWLKGMGGLLSGGLIVKGIIVFVAANSWNPAGWTVAAATVAATLVTALALAVWNVIDFALSLFDSEYKKRQQKKAIDETVKEFEKTLRTALNKEKNNLLDQKKSENGVIKVKISKLVTVLEMQKEILAGFKNFLQQQKLYVIEGEMFYG